MSFLILSEILFIPYYQNDLQNNCRFLSNLKRRFKELYLEIDNKSQKAFQKFLFKIVNQQNKNKFNLFSEKTTNNISVIN
jgi:hypothetical protein